MFDLHFHTNASDGAASLRTVRERLAASPQLRRVAIADHDTLLLSIQLVQTEPRAWVAGEFSSRTGSIPTDVLGINVDPTNAPLSAYLSKRSVERQVRFDLFGDALRARGWRFELDADGLGHPNPGQPHVVDELRRHSDNVARLVKMGIGPRNGTRDQDKIIFDQVIVPLQITKGGMTLATTEAMIDLIHGAGGLAIIAHPWIHPYEHGKRKSKGRSLVADWVNKHGLDGLELWHHDQSDPLVAAFIRAEAAAHGLLLSAGSDDHSIDLVDLGTPAPPADEAEAALERLEVAARRRRG